VDQPQEATTISITVAYKIVIAQIVITLLMAVVGLAWLGTKAAYSAALGGSISVIGTLILVLIMFNQRAKEAKQMLFAFYLGEATKLAVTVVLFVLAFIFIDLNAGFFMATFIIAVVANWLGLLLVNK